MLAIMLFFIIISTVSILTYTYHRHRMERMRKHAEEAEKDVGRPCSSEQTTDLVFYGPEPNDGLEETFSREHAASIFSRYPSLANLN